MTTLPPFWSLVESYGGELLAYARKLVGAEAEDVLQEALLRALRSYPRVRDDRHLRAWLYRITTTTAFDVTARRSQRNETLHDAPPAPSVELVYDDGSFDDLIAPLTEGARRALAMRFRQDLSYDQIAQRLGCSPQAARQRVSTAVRELRRRLT